MGEGWPLMTREPMGHSSLVDLPTTMLDSLRYILILSGIQPKEQKQMFHSAEPNQTSSRIHWTARAGFYLSFFAVMSAYVFSSIESFHSISIFISYLAYYISILLPVPALILSCIALFISRRSPWRRGREFAILGLVMSTILCLGLAEIFSIQCCFRLHSLF